MTEPKTLTDGEIQLRKEVLVYWQKYAKHKDGDGVYPPMGPQITEPRYLATIVADRKRIEAAERVIRRVEAAENYGLYLPTALLQDKDVYRERYRRAKK